MYRPITRKDVAYRQADSILAKDRRRREYIRRNRPRQPMTHDEFRARLMRDLGMESHG